MGTSSKELARKLRKLASRQHGCFTAAQAIATGYADSVHLYHLKNGEWIRVFRGIYRLADAPETPAARCTAALLWTRDKNGEIQGFLSPETAEQLQSGSLPPDQPIQVQVPKGFRRSSEVPPGILITVAENGNHKTSNILDVEARKASRAPVGGSVLPPAAIDTPDYYDWLDYQAVLCEKSP